MKTLRIGDITIDPPLLLAPMEQVTNVAFRLLCKRYGAGLVCTEMIHDEYIERVELEKIRKARISEKERPLMVQICGNDKHKLLRSARMIGDRADLFNLNVGCPGANVITRKAGAALLAHPKQVVEIGDHLAANLTQPFTVKMRTGISERSIVAEKLCRDLQAVGCAAVMIHARTLKQGYNGRADWDLIGKIHKSLDIPVIGNGDIADEETAMDMLERCDGLMIGRSAMKDPSIFRRIQHFIRTKKRLPAQGYEEKVRILYEYIDIAQQQGIADATDIKMRAMSFTKGIEGGSELRNKLARCKTMDDIMAILPKPL